MNIMTTEEQDDGLFNDILAQCDGHNSLDVVNALTDAVIAVVKQMEKDNFAKAITLSMLSATMQCIIEDLQENLDSPKLH